MTYPPPGPELDALVAERVMGWILEPGFSRDWVDDQLRAFRKKPNGSIFVSTIGSAYDHPLYNGHPVWRGSTYIKDAEEVLNHMTTSTKETWEFFFCSTGARATFDYEGGRDRPWKPGIYDVYGDDLPHAICLAALEAVKG